MTQDLPVQDLPGEEQAKTAGDAVAHPAAAVASLRQAMRRARHDNAERAGVLADQRSARLGRLELLGEALKPLVAQIPTDIDFFDVALMPGSNPRLFIDMIGFVEMGRDARQYRLLQDTRNGRLVLAESESVDAMVDAVTDYVARRLLERDRALAADTKQRPPSYTRAEAAPASSAVPGAARRRGGPLRWLGIAFAFLIDLLGAVAFFAVLAALAWYAWNRLHAPV